MNSRQELLEKTRKERALFSPSDFPRSFFDSGALPVDWRDSFKDIEGYVMFIGYPRSGHSVIGAILDAHPEAIIAHELNVVEYVRLGYTRDEIFYLLLLNSRLHASVGRAWGEYSYALDGQGEYRKLRVIGDKRGSRTSRLFHQWPDLFDKTRETFGASTKFIHVIRNPFDTITQIRRRPEYVAAADRPDDLLAEAIDWYFENVAANKKLRTLISPDHLCEIRHEDFVANPVVGVTTLLKFLNLSEDEEYIARSTRIVNSSPHASRHLLAWPDYLIENVLGRLTDFDFLNSYTFDN